MFILLYVEWFFWQLYNVIVDTEVTGKKLLQKGDLRRRYTIIPLNKIAARSINDKTVKAAQQVVSNLLLETLPGA